VPSWPMQVRVQIGQEQCSLESSGGIGNWVLCHGGDHRQTENRMISDGDCKPGTESAVGNVDFSRLKMELSVVVGLT